MSTEATGRLALPLNDGLGPLPEPQELAWNREAQPVLGYTPQQVEAERQRCYLLGMAAARKAAAKECLSILLDGRYWNGAPQIAHEGASDRAAEIRRVFGL